MHVNAYMHYVTEGTLAAPTPHFFILPSRTKTTNRKPNHWAHLHPPSICFCRENAASIQHTTLLSSLGGPYHLKGSRQYSTTSHTLQQRNITLIWVMPYCTTSKPYFHATIVESDLNHRTYKTHPYKNVKHIISFDSLEKCTLYRLLFTSTTNFTLVSLLK